MFNVAIMAHFNLNEKLSNTLCILFWVTVGKHMDTLGANTLNTRTVCCGVQTYTLQTHTALYGTTTHNRLFFHSSFKGVQRSPSSFTLQFTLISFLKCCV